MTRLKIFLIFIGAILLIVLAKGWTHQMSIPDRPTVKLFTQPACPTCSDKIVYAYSDGEDAIAVEAIPKSEPVPVLIQEKQELDDFTGIQWIDDTVRFLWNYCGTLLLLIGFFVALAILRNRSEIELTEPPPTTNIYKPLRTKKAVIHGVDPQSDELFQTMTLMSLMHFR